jgi:hypothetical protein
MVGVWSASQSGIRFEITQRALTVDIPEVFIMLPSDPQWVF